MTLATATSGTVIRMVRDYRRVARKSAGLLMFRAAPRLASRSCSCTRAARCGQKRTTARGRFRRVRSTPTKIRSPRPAGIEEELGCPVSGEFIALATIRQASGKVVHAWAVEGDFDPATLSGGMFSMEWPPRSGRQQQFPEVDRASRSRSKTRSARSTRRRFLCSIRSVLARPFDSIDDEHVQRAASRLEAKTELILQCGRQSRRVRHRRRRSSNQCATETLRLKNNVEINSPVSPVSSTTGRRISCVNGLVSSCIVMLRAENQPGASIAPHAAAAARRAGG